MYRLRTSKDVLVLTHRNADVDAVASAMAVAMVSKSFGRGKRICLVSPSGMSVQSRKVVEEFGFEFMTEIPQKSFDVAFVTDTGHSALLREQTEVLKGLKSYKVLIDHHPLDESMKAVVDRAVTDVTSSSASELVFRLAEKASVKVGRKMAQVLLLGIMADSQFLTLASNRTIAVVHRLCTLGGDVEKARTLLRMRRDVSESIARIKGAKRGSYYRAGEWLVAVSTIGSFQASVARALVELGADVAMAVGEAEGETRASMRSTQIFKERTGLHLGTDVCKEIANRLGGSGGGHPTAASMNLKVPPDKVLASFKEALEARLGQKLKELA